MSKPSWDDAPEWAEYLAMDANGNWFWYEKEPTPKRHSWVISSGKFRQVTQLSAWKESLEKRPNPQIVVNEKQEPV